MKHLASLLPATLVVAALGCQADTRKLEQQLDRLGKDVAEIKVDVAAIKAGGGPQRPAAAQRPARPEPDPTKVYAMPVDGDPSIGPADAKITIVKGYEYACPFCDKVRPTIDQIMKDYPGEVRVVFKQHVVHPQVATDASLGACAAHKQGKFEAMDAALWEKAFRARKFDADNIKAIAKELGLDMARFTADMTGDCVQFIAKDQAAIQKLGASSTPNFFINGRYVVGARPLPSFKAVIDEELAKANERIAAGTAKADYYRTWVLEKGLKSFEAPTAAAPTAAPIVVKPAPPAAH